MQSTGDTYMVACGVPKREDFHAEVMATLALNLLHHTTVFHIPHQEPRQLQLRIGINSGQSQLSSTVLFLIIVLICEAQDMLYVQGQWLAVYWAPHASLTASLVTLSTSHLVWWPPVQVCHIGTCLKHLYTATKDFLSEQTFIYESKYTSVAYTRRPLIFRLPVEVISNKMKYDCCMVALMLLANVVALRIHLSTKTAQILCQSQQQYLLEIRGKRTVKVRPFDLRGQVLPINAIFLKFYFLIYLFSLVLCVV